MRTIVCLVMAGCGLMQAETGDRLGTINAVSGDARLNGEPVTSPEKQIAPGDQLQTGRGMAEILLAPGNFLRIGDQSAITLTSPSPSQAKVRLEKGVAILESLNSNSNPVIYGSGLQCLPVGPGLFEFDKRRNTVIVFSGEVHLLRERQGVTVGKGFEADIHSLKTGPIKSRPGDDLYAWASFRSEQLSSISAAVRPEDTHLSAGTPSWVKMPWTDSYTYIAPSGYVNSAFGWPFYAPGHSHNYIPFPGSGDKYLYGPPVLPPPALYLPGAPTFQAPPHPAAPLTAPGVPSFPKSR